MNPERVVRFSVLVALILAGGTVLSPLAPVDAVAQQSGGTGVAAGGRETVSGGAAKVDSCSEPATAGTKAGLRQAAGTFIAHTQETALGPLASTGTATGGAIEDISGSYAAWDGGAYGDLCWAPGANYICFNYHVQSYTWAWPYGLQMKLPSGWNATNGYLLDGWSCTGGGYPGTLTFTGGNEPVWSQTWNLSSSGDECDAVYCIDVTAANSAELDAIPWYITSDGYGGGVVDTCDNSGYYSCGEAVQPPADVPHCAAGIYLTPAAQDGSGCGGETVDYSLALYNNTAVSRTFYLTYDAVWSTSGPGSLYVAAGATESIAVSVGVACSGEDTATVSASGGGYSDSATIHTAVSGGGWIAEPASPAVTMDNPAISYDGKLYVVDGYGSYGAVQIFDGASWTSGASSGMNAYVVDACLGLNASGDPVIDLFGDTTTFFTMARYDINANSWSFPALPPGFPASGLWAPDIVSMLQHNGQNRCYIVGGATTSGGGNTNALYRYNPETMAVTDLGDFSYLPAGIAFHFAWYAPWIGASGAICAGGGVDVNSVVSGDTQCYRISENSFNTPNADLGPLPQPWWGGGDAWKDGGQYELWGVNGVDAAFAMLQKSFYWNGSALVYGPDPLYGVYRMEADNFAGSVFAANGSTGGFSPSTLEESLQVCGPCNNPPNTPSNPAPPDGAQCTPTSTDLTWSGGDPDGDTVTYDVYLEANADPPSVKVCSAAPTEFCDPGTLSNNTHYFWRVRAIDEHDGATNGPVWGFFVHANSAPNTPTSPIPADNATKQSVNVNLEWTGTDPNGDSLTYDVYFEPNDTDPDVLKCDDASTAFCDPGTLTYGTHYYWKVVSQDDCGAVKTGPIWDFTTNYLPNVPGNPSPPDGATGQPVSVNLGWTGGDPDDPNPTYDVYAEINDSTPDVLVCNDTPYLTCDPGSLQSNAHYYWYVKATDPHGASATSPTFDFFTTAGRVYLPFVLNGLSSFAPPCSAANQWCEENDDWSTAYGPLQEGQVYSAHPDDAQDMYFFTMPTTADVTVLVTNYGSKDGALAVYDSAQNRRGYDWEEDPGGDDQMRVFLGSLQAGIYYIQVYTESGYSSSAFYSLSWSR